MSPSKKGHKEKHRTESAHGLTKPVSSHPDADPPSARPLVTESDWNDYKSSDKRRKAIVSINGEDVPQSPTRRRVA